MWFTTVCPACGTTYKLLEKFRDCKVMCDCGVPFLAGHAGEPALDVAELAPDQPAKGWLLVCPSCAHAETISEDPYQSLACSRCGSALVPPVTPSKRLRTSRGRRRPPRKPDR